MSVPKKLPGSLHENRKLGMWVRFNADHTMTLFPGRVEIGQGVITALAQIAAEELDLTMGQIRLESASTKGSPNEGHTSGSRSIDDGGAAVRYACAEVRAIMLRAAAERLDLPVEKLSVEEGRIAGFDRIREISYWDLPHADLLNVDASGNARPKHPQTYRIVGTGVARVDIPDKVAGAPRFVQDLTLPELVHGRVLRPPSYDAELEHFDTGAVRALPGVVSVVQDGRFIGVIAEREEQAVKARAIAQRAARWRSPASLPNPRDIDAYLKQHADAPTTISSKTAATAATAKTLRASYSRPYTAHASMGPSSAVAQWNADRTRLEVWTHSQGVYPLRGELARVLDMPVDAITVNHVEGAGCYGHNGADDAALDAVYLAREVAPRPLKLQWSREDEFGWEPYGPAMLGEISAALDESGSIVQWNYDFWSNPHSGRPGHGKAAGRASALLASWHLAQPFARTPLWDPPLAGGGGSDRNAIPLYEFPNQRINKHLVHATPLRTSTLRALGAYANVFAIESFMDELAAAAGADPVEFRLRHMKEPRARAVIELAAEKYGWARGSKAEGRGRGFAFGQYKNGYGYIGMVCDVDVEREPRVTRVVCAVDVGQIINSDGVANQIEGGIVQAISWTLKEQVTFDTEKILSRDWETYPILGFHEVPEIEVHLIDRPDEAPLGAGEVPTGPTAGAIGNAIYDALGVRLRDLPLTREKIVAALSQ
jgi:CO/xanthine dehydrogenase Mo-binding subunit